MIGFTCSQDGIKKYNAMGDWLVASSFPENASTTFLRFKSKINKIITITTIHIFIKCFLQKFIIDLPSFAIYIIRQ